MKAVLDFINTHIYDIFIPLTALAVLRIIVCLAQLKTVASHREKKGVYHAVTGHYAEIGAWLGTLVGFVPALVLPRLWYLWLAVAVVGAVFGGKAGKKKGAELDNIYREVAWELKHEAAAQAAREEASHTLEDGAELPESDEAAGAENTDNEGETENG